jgi:hypothetical protein
MRLGNKTKPVNKNTISNHKDYLTKVTGASHFHQLKGQEMWTISHRDREGLKG